MSADFWAGYISGAIGILIGNPLDLLKTRLQAGPPRPLPPSASPPRPPWTDFARGAAAPILGYGALNALLFVAYNRSLALLTHGQLVAPSDAPAPSALNIWAAGALGGFATFVVSAPTELVKCRAQVANPPQSSLQVTKELWGRGGLRGLYLGGQVTSVRDAVGYGFYFWSYEMSKRALHRADDSPNQQALKVLLCGGLAGVVTWASVFPLDVVKTRVQTWDLLRPEAARRPLLREHSSVPNTSGQGHPGAFRIAKDAYRAEGVTVFFRGLGVCSARAFIVNAVQWAMYEWTMKILTS